MLKATERFLLFFASSRSGTHAESVPDDRCLSLPVLNMDEKHDGADRARSTWQSRSAVCDAWSSGSTRCKTGSDRGTRGHAWWRGEVRGAKPRAASPVGGVGGGSRWPIKDDPAREMKARQLAGGSSQVSRCDGLAQVCKRVGRATVGLERVRARLVRGEFRL